jgi:hypothetical protein
VTRTIFTQTAV